MKEELPPQDYGFRVFAVVELAALACIIAWKDGPGAFLTGAVWCLKWIPALALCFTGAFLFKWVAVRTWRAYSEYRLAKLRADVRARFKALEAEMAALPPQAWPPIEFLPPGSPTL